MKYVVSDIHGHYTHFLKLLEEINFTDDDTLYILGDIIDRGPENINLVRKVMSTPNIKMILGNHEDMMLGYYKGKSIFDKAYFKAIWYRNGGDYTDREFKTLEKEEQDKILDYFLSLPLELEVTVNGVVYNLVHGSYVDDSIKVKLNENEYSEIVLWERINPKDNGPKNKVVVFGHTCTKYYKGNVGDKYTIWNNNNLIGIDCGMAGFTRNPLKSQLGCLCLDNLEEIYI